MWQTVFPAALRTEGLVSALGRQKGSRHQGAQRTEPCGLQNVASFCRPLERQKWIPSLSLFDSSGCYLPVLLNRGEIQGWFLDVFGVAWNPLLKIETVSLNYVILLARLVCTCAWVHASTLIHTHIHTPSRSLSLSFAHMPPSSHSLLLSPPPGREENLTGPSLPEPSVFKLTSELTCANENLLQLQEKVKEQQRNIELSFLESESLTEPAHRAVVRIKCP